MWGYGMTYVRGSDSRDGKGSGIVYEKELE